MFHSCTQNLGQRREHKVATSETSICHEAVYLVSIQVKASCDDVLTGAPFRLHGQPRWIKSVGDHDHQKANVMQVRISQVATSLKSNSLAACCTDRVPSTRPDRPQL